MTLNPQQQQAVDTLHGPLMLLAGAGSGKTRVIIQRIANLIRHGILPENILAVTFTNKAAAEMRERVAGLLSRPVADKVTVSTFHAFCLNVLRRHIHHLGYSRHFAIATEGYQYGLVREIISEHHLNGNGCDPGLWLALISRAKAALQSPADLELQDLPRAADVALVYRLYQQRLQQMDLVDFDDLLGLTVKLWNLCPDVLQAYREQCRYILIDEYQDTNSVQLRLMVMLAGPNPNICVVGDDDQSIYGWRGANLGNILDFENFFPGAKVIRLEQNYRSTNTILKAANAIIAQNKARRPKSLWSNQGDGEKILVVRCDNETDEATFIADFLQDAARSRHWADLAVLFRTGHQSRALEEAFRHRRVPYILVGANSFFKRKEVLDATAFLRLVANPHDDLALLQIINVPPRGIGDATIQKLRDLRSSSHRHLDDLLVSDVFRLALPPDTADSCRSFHDLIAEFRARIPDNAPVFPFAKELLDRLGYCDGLVRMYKPREDALKRRDNVLEFLSAIADYDDAHFNKGSLREFLEQFDLQDAQDRLKDKTDKKGDAVTMMTVHASKGLEFPLVVVAGMEQGLFPHQTAIDEGNIEEERRLCYVAVTRAKERLVLTHCGRRRVMNQIVAKRPSHFLDEIPDSLVTLATPKTAIRPATLEESESFLAAMRKMLED